MNNSRITSTIEEWNGRYRASMYVDGHRVSKAFFDTREEAERWTNEQRDLLRQEVREFN